MRSLVETTWTSCACDVCGANGDSLELLGTRVDRIAQRDHDYLWRHEDVQCRRCGFVFNRLRPEPEFLRAHYSDCWPIASTSVAIAPDFDVSRRLSVLARWLRPRARLYEIGDKLGEFHAALVAAGYEVAGDDVMGQANERAGWLAGLFQRERAAEPPTAMRGAFDGALAYFVVEHLANPRQWLRSMRALLAPGGVLVIEVPHFERHPAEGLMHEHFLYLTPESLSALVAEAGFEVAELSEDGASRPFGFCLVARRTEQPQAPALEPLAAKSAALRVSYQRGRALLDTATENLATTARLAADAALSGPPPARVCFFGANQTATDIAAHLRPLLGAAEVPLLPFDNSDVKTGTTLAGFSSPVQKPTASAFDPATLHVCVISSRGWTEAIAEQIRGFRLPRVVLLDGAAARLLPRD
jgi:SAM-dependent methyltransferase